MSTDIYKVTLKVLKKLEASLEYSETKSTLSHLRRSLGHNISESFAIWPLVFEELPPEYLSSSGKPTYQENAILSALQFYAMHQQGNSSSVNEVSGMSVGKALHSIREINNTALDKRFNAMITSRDFKELTTHLRHLISILKQKSSVRIDYAKLAEDLYWHQISKEAANQMRLRWGQDYYYYQKIEKEGK